MQKSNNPLKLTQYLKQNLPTKNKLQKRSKIYQFTNFTAAGSTIPLFDLTLNSAMELSF